MNQTPPTPMRAMWHVDTPRLDGPRGAGETLSYAGWIAGSVRPGQLSAHPGDLPGPGDVDLQIVERPDVAPVLGIPGLQVIGFKGSCPRAALADRDCFRLTFCHGREWHEIVIPAPLGEPHSLANKRDKLRRLTTLLRCPECGGTLIEGDERLDCACGQRYPASDCIDFLTADVQAAYRLASTDAVSQNQYDGEIINIVNRHQRGWVLDCGAGHRDVYYENVVNFEIEAFDTTDVRGLGERLPFRDGCFDAVISCAVLEHVRDPFQCAREIIRVLKPGGQLYCQVPFLQPFHGYPDHYYNMTERGLLNLFGEAIDVEHLGPLNFGQPIAALNWILQSYAAGLEPATAEHFLDMRVRDLIKPNTETLLAEHVAGLADATRRMLSCCNLLVGRKS